MHAPEINSSISFLNRQTVISTYFKQPILACVAHVSSQTYFFIISPQMIYVSVSECWKS